MIRLALLLPVLLAACGVAGPPIPPSQARRDPASATSTPPAVTISGSVGVGVGVGGRL